MTYFVSSQVAKLQYIVTAFLTGFSLMTVEIISSRIVAPLIGSSIYTWASVIGVILLGLSIGNIVGGICADRYVRAYGKKVLAVALLASAAFVLLILPLAKNAAFIVDGSYSIAVMSMLVCGVLFLLPSIALGAVSPILFELYVADIADIGKKYGVLSGVWSLGSIVGVFVTGFYFISTIGSSGTVYLVTFVLMVLCYFFYISSIDRQSASLRWHVAGVVLSALTLLIALFMFSQKGSVLSSSVLFHTETAYYDVKVVDYTLFPQYGNNRILFLDLDSHSIHTEKPSELFYTDIAPAFSALSSHMKNIFVIGAGAYTLPINLRTQYPDAQITVSEIDPELEKVGRAYFNLDAYNIQTKVGDARVALASARRGTEKYDLIFGDAYSSFISVPWHLLTKEAMTDARASLNPDGIFAINFIGALEGPEANMFESVYSTMREVFPNNYLFAFGNSPAEIQSITIVGVRGDTHVSHDVLKQKLDSINASHFLSKRLVDKNSADESRWVKEGQVLTDDFAPVEQLMAGLMRVYFPPYLALYHTVLSS